jgi:hypothetical protein
MSIEMKYPLDDENYGRDIRSKAITSQLPDGAYVFVRDVDGTIYVLPDGPHQHPKVLGSGKPAVYAGDFSKRGQFVTDLTTLSGTFQFEDATDLLAVAKAFEEIGLTIQPGAVRLFSYSSGQRAQILR